MTRLRLSKNYIWANHFIQKFERVTPVAFKSRSVLYGLRNRGQQTSSCEYDNLLLSGSGEFVITWTKSCTNLTSGYKITLEYFDFRSSDIKTRMIVKRFWMREMTKFYQKGSYFFPISSPLYLSPLGSLEVIGLPRSLKPLDLLELVGRRRLPRDNC